MENVGRGGGRGGKWKRSKGGGEGRAAQWNE